MPSLHTAADTGARGGATRISLTERRGVMARRAQTWAARGQPAKRWSAVSSSWQEAQVGDGAQFLPNRLTRVLSRSPISRRAKILILLGSLEHQMSMEAWSSTSCGDNTRKAARELKATSSPQAMTWWSCTSVRRTPRMSSRTASSSAAATEDNQGWSARPETTTAATDVLGRVEWEKSAA